MRIGVLTGGGDCPGLNAAIRAVVRSAERSYDDEVLGFHHGWRGVVEGDCFDLTSSMTRGILGQGGTILGTARYHPHEHQGALDGVCATAKRERLDAIVVIGGDGTLDAARYVAEAGVSVVGMPKTIDNDVSGTEVCIGFDTAVSTATDAIDRLHTTAESHDRTMVIELMGRSSGWLAICAGLAGGADKILVPEEPVALDEVVAALERRHRGGASYSIVVVAEGVRLVDQSSGPVGNVATTGNVTAPDQDYSIGRLVADGVASGTGFETRLAVLGHIQRGGPATARDRLIGTRFGAAAVDAVHQGCSSHLVAMVGDEMQTVDLVAVTAGARRVPSALLAVATRLTAP